MKKSMCLIFVLALAVFSVGVSAVDTYISDELFGNDAACEEYTNIFSLEGADGVNYNYCVKNETWTDSSGGADVNVSGGLISSLNISATIQNPHWKAFVGWVDGKFTLDDSSDSSIYDWSLSSIDGQVYASRNASTVDWENIDCATVGEILAEDVALEHSGEDNISSTFSGTNTGTYTVAGFSVGVGDCLAANSYVNNLSQSASFEEFVLHDSVNVVFATEIEDAVAGYDGINYDFQMIVPENGNESFTSNTAYYLYVEVF